jgi:lipid-binding SYLF domain-containing protein
MNRIVKYATWSCMLIPLVTLPLAGSALVAVNQEPVPDGQENQENVVRSDLDDETQYSSGEVAQAIQQRLAEAAAVAMDMNNVPAENLREAHCIGVIPAALEGAFLIGYQYGRGVMTCRQSSTRDAAQALGGPPDRNIAAWSNPSMMAVDAASIGLQVGATSTDIIVLLMTPSALELSPKETFVSTRRPA